MTLVTFTLTTILLAASVVGGGAAPTPKIAQTLARSAGGMISLPEAPLGGQAGELTMTWPAPPSHYNLSEPTYSADGSVATAGWVDMEQARHSYIADFAIEQEAARVAAAARQACIDHIDRTFARKGSPLAGYGHVFLEAQERTGVSAALIVGLTAAESSFATDGYLCRSHHNAFGMKWNERVTAGNVDGWCWWPDWAAGVNGAADFIIAWWGQAQTAYDLRGYCEGNPPNWITTVETVRGQVLRGFGGGGSDAG